MRCGKQIPPAHDMCHTLRSIINGDGKVTMADASILMLNLLSEDPRYDFNLDGEVDTNDLEILIRTK